MSTHFYPSFAKKFLSVLLFFTVGIIYAQDSYVLYGINNIPQSTYLNPATNPNANFFIGFPALSQVQVGAANSLGAFNDIVHKKAGTDSIYLDLSSLIGSTNKLHFLGVNFNQDLLFAGFRANKAFITFGVRQRLMVQMLISNDLLKLIDNADALNSNAQYDLSNTVLNENHFLDYHIGASLPITDKIRAGARLHIFQGLSNIHTVNNKLNFSTTSTNNDFELYANTDLTINTSGLPDSLGFEPDYMLNFQNFGFGIDLGVEVQVNKQLKVSASLLDMGKINYKAYNQNFSSKANNVTINSNTFDFQNGNTVESFADSIKQYLNFQQTSASYSASLPMRLMVAADYFTKNQQNQFSFLFSGRFYENYFMYASALSYSRNFSKHVTFKASYTYMKESPFNVGAALSFQFRPLQVYIYSDNIFGVQWDRSRFVQAGFGINFVFPPKDQNTTKDNPGN
ncbi:MAG: hypothetical protein JXR65_03800 [Bacteroidales bacterium]|nr:hypothetical protein [Bacteroidales bacterium]